MGAPPAGFPAAAEGPVEHDNGQEPITRGLSQHMLRGMEVSPRLQHLNVRGQPKRSQLLESHATSSPLRRTTETRPGTDAWNP